MVKVIAAVVLFLTVYICGTMANRKENRQQEQLSMTFVNIDTAALNFRQSVYVPVNADRHTKKALKKNLTTVLKIRNTSFSDSLYLFKVHYFDREGQPLKKFVDSAMLVRPMATAEIVVKNKDFDTAGDNFIVEWRANSPKHFPLIQAISSAPDNCFVLREDGIVLAEDAELIN